MPSTEPDEIQDNISIFEQSSPESLRSRPPLPPPAHDQQSSTSDEQTLSADTEDDYFQHYQPKRCSSSRSSISSFPASVIHNTLLTDYEDGGRILSKSPGRSDSPAYKLNGPGYMSAFRNPSSVRALQLGESEFTDTDALSIARNHRSRKSPKISYFGPRSPGSTQSSPTKRSSRPATPQQRSSSKLKKEFPLVLLHCTILAPAVATRVSQVSEDIYEAVLPEEYKKRWRTLQDKVAKNSEIRQRGVLISHPHEDYDVLEERLLETLELERPRIRQHHFLGPKIRDGTDSGFESSSQTDEGSDSEREGREKCPDCGKAVSCKTEQERKWQVKVYAANGLMKGGAWAAAWQEMEKVDVEVGLWMPEDVRAEVDERLTALQAQHEAEKPVDESPPGHRRRPRSKSNRTKLRHDERMKEIYGEVGQSRTQQEIDGLAEELNLSQEASLGATTTRLEEDLQRSAETAHTSDRQPHVRFAPEPAYHSSHNQLDLATLVRLRLNNIMQDQKSLVIILLSMLVLFFAIQNMNKQVATQVAVESPSYRYETTALAQEAVTPTAKEPVVSYVTTTVFATPSSSSSLEAEPTSTAYVDDDNTNSEQRRRIVATNIASALPAIETTPTDDLDQHSKQDAAKSPDPSSGIFVEFIETGKPDALIETSSLRTPDIPSEPIETPSQAPESHADSLNDLASNEEVQAPIIMSDLKIVYEAQAQAILRLDSGSEMTCGLHSADQQVDPNATAEPMDDGVIVEND